MIQTQVQFLGRELISHFTLWLTAMWDQGAEWVDVSWCPYSPRRGKEGLYQGDSREWREALWITCPVSSAPGGTCACQVPECIVIFLPSCPLPVPPFPPLPHLLTPSLATLSLFLSSLSHLELHLGQGTENPSSGLILMCSISESWSRRKGK